MEELQRIKEMYRSSEEDRELLANLVKKRIGHSVIDGMDLVKELIERNIEDLDYWEFVEVILFLKRLYPHIWTSTPIFSPKERWSQMRWRYRK